MTEIISGLFSLTEAEMDSLGPFVPSFFITRHAGGVPLEIECSWILQHWEDHFAHMFLALTDFHKSSEDMAYVHCKKLEKIELFLVHTGYLMKGKALKDALESGVAVIAQLANVIKDLEAELEAPCSVTNLTILDTIPDSAPATHTHDLMTITIPTLASSTLAACPSSPSLMTGLTDLQSRGYYTHACAHAEHTLSGSISASARQMGLEWVTQLSPDNGSVNTHKCWNPGFPFNHFVASSSTFPTPVAIWIQLVHRPKDLLQKVPMAKLWECPNPHCPFTMDATYPHDMVPFAWGFQEIGQGLMKNFHIHHPPPQDWSLVEEYLPPLVMIEDSEEDDMDDVQDKRNNLIAVPGPLQHPTSVQFLTSVDQRAMATADLGAGSKEEVYRQLAAPSDVVANESDITSGSATLGISLDEWIKVWLPTMDPNF
ncbi:hypothetical protein ARMGADRAFT_1022998 [Armillaria gallica]|uniref:Uncharacterized protein n=1 Tax=Armillaria gallica TaxID=47427 RepID=A0A2H3ERW5_ARMGA|nr:hypothetical protein ARMGADRAFT_1022998 [Armillaria gallica]